MENKYKVNLGDSLVSGTSTGYGTTDTLIVVHPEFPNIKLMAVASADEDCIGASEAASLFCNVVKKKFQNLNSAFFEVSGYRDPLEYSEVCMMDVASNIMTHAGIAISEMNKKAEATTTLTGLKPYLISATIVVTDGMSAYAATLGDTRCCYFENGAFKTLTRVETASDLCRAGKYNEDVLLKLLDRPTHKPVSYVGDYSDLAPMNLQSLPYMALDSIVLMNNGVYRSLDNEMLRQIMSDCNPMDFSENIILAADGLNKFSNDLAVISLVKSPRKKLVLDDD